MTFVDFLQSVEPWVSRSEERIYAIMDNLCTLKALLSEEQTLRSE